MGDVFFSIVVENVANKTIATQLIDTVVGQLIEEGQIEAKQTNCGMGSQGYPPGPNAPGYIHRYGGANGLVVEVGRGAYGFAQGTLIAECPSCENQITETEAISLISDWEDESFDGFRTCPDCSKRSHVNRLEWLDAQPLFGSLAFVFWNWPEVEIDYDEVEQISGSRVLTGLAKL